MKRKWQNAVAHANCTIKEVIQIIDREATRAAFVVDKNNTLLGVVTDGDIRRALLKNISFDSSVENIMQTKPITCKHSESLDTARAMMEQHQLLHMPIVRDETLVDVVTIEDFSRVAKVHNPVFIMAGGFGTRLRPLTDSCPKPMLNVGEKPILDNIITRFIRFGFYKFYVSVHYKSEMITSYFGDGSSRGISIEYVEEKTPLGTAGALGLLQGKELNLPMIVINGDILTQINFKELLEYHQKKSSIATMCVRQYSYQVPYGVIETDGGLVTSITEKPEYDFFVNSGIYVLDPQLVIGVSPNTRIDMPDLLRTSMAKGLEVSMYPLHEYWLDIGKMQDFEKAQADYAQFFQSDS